MPNLRSGKTKPWIARVSCDGYEYFLGYYLTEKLAEEVETEFREGMGIKPRVPKPRKAKIA